MQGEDEARAISEAVLLPLAWLLKIIYPVAPLEALQLSCTLSRLDPCEADSPVGTGGGRGTSHFAYSVCAAVIVTVVAEVTSVPVPPGPVHQPANVYPVRVVVASVP